jgi:intracellular septation protein
MTDAPAKTDAPAAKSGQGAQLLVDVGPIAVFMVVYNLANRSRPEDAIYIATGVFIATTLAALAYALFRQKRFPSLLVVTAAIVTLFGGATLLFRDALFIKLKPTVINLLYAAAIFGSLAIRQNIAKLFLGSAFTLPDRVWRNFAIRLGLWFTFLAILNEVVWRNFSEAFWVNFKFFGVLPLTFLFFVANALAFMKHAEEPETKKADPAE